MFKKDEKDYAESLEEYYSICGDKEHKPGAQQIMEAGIDLASRYGLSDEEYKAVKTPIRIYGGV